MQKEFVLENVWKFECKKESKHGWKMCELMKMFDRS